MANPVHPSISKGVTVKSQCGACRDPLDIIAASNTWCRIFSYYNITSSVLSKFSESINGAVLYPWSSGYNTQRLVYNKVINEFPAIIVFVHDASDIKKSFAFIREHKMPVTVRSGGHSFEGFSLSPGLVIDVSNLNRVEVLKEKNIAVIGSGALIGPTLTELQKYDAIIPLETDASVGIVSLTLGGGIGFLSRKWGLACDSLLAVEIVLSNGKEITADKDHHSDLFWACKGGGGGMFGIITKSVFSTHSLKHVVTLKITYPWSVVKNAISLFQRWAPHTDKSLTMELVLQGKDHDISFVGQWTGSKKALYNLIHSEVYNVLGKPTSFDMKEVSVLDAAREYSDNNTQPPFFKVKSSFIKKPISVEEIQTLIDVTAPIPESDKFTKVVLSALRGKISEVKKDETAYLNRDAECLLEYATYWDYQREEKEHMKWITSAFESMKDYVSPFSYVNFVDIQLKDWKYAYWGSHYERLSKIKLKYDPDDICRLPQGVRPY